MLQDSLIKSWISYKRQLNDAKNYVQEIKQISRLLEKKLIMAHEATGNGFTELSSTFGYKALNISAQTMPMLNRIDNALNKSNDKVESQIRSFKQSREVLYNNTSLLLKNQEAKLRDSLNYSLARQKRYEQKAKLLKAKMTLNNNKIGIQERKLETLAIEKATLTRLKADIDQREAEAKRTKRQIADTKSALANLSYCPNNVPWIDCTHVDEKKAYKRDKQALEKKMEGLQIQRISSENFVRENTPRYTRRAIHYNKSIDLEREILRQLQQGKAGLESDGDEIGSNFLKYNALANLYEKLQTELEAQKEAYYSMGHQ